MTTPPPAPDDGHQYDHLDPYAAVFFAWTIPCGEPEWVELAKDRVRACMPLLGRALDRAAMAREYQPSEFSAGVIDPDALVAMLSEADQAAGMPYDGDAKTDG